jgi:hypothetical protein
MATHSLYERLNFNLIGDIAPIAGIFRTADVMGIGGRFASLNLGRLAAGELASPLHHQPIFGNCSGLFQPMISR